MLLEKKFDQLTFRVYKTRPEMGEAAAKDALSRMEAALKAKGRINVLFAAAPSQSDMLAVLKKSGFDWARVNAFHMDEYVGLPADAPQGFSNFLRREIWDGLPFASVHPINGNADPEAECVRYDRLLRDNPIDVCLCGVGENCHLAFNDPGFAKFDDKMLAKVVALDEVCRQQQVNDGCFASLDLVPTHAITLTMPIFSIAPQVIAVVPAATKANAVYNTATQPISEDYPSTILRNHPAAVLYTDEKGGARLLEG